MPSKAALEPLNIHFKNIDTCTRYYKTTGISSTCLKIFRQNSFLSIHAYMIHMCIHAQNKSFQN